MPKLPSSCLELLREYTSNIPILPEVQNPDIVCIFENAFNASFKPNSNPKASKASNTNAK